MSFGSGGFGFGQNNQATTTGFGGFGANNNTASTGFGTNTTAFGSAQNTGTGLFGSTGTTGFGSSTGGFGSSTAGGFGAKPFGAATTSSGSLFGSTTATAGSTGFGSGGGFGAPMASGTTTGGFGSGTNTMFGAAKPAFGASTTTGGLFGSAATTTTPAFGSATTGFGAATATANAGDPPGTNTVPFQAFVEKEATSNQHNSFQNILFMDAYKKWSAEELRLADYNQGRRFGNAAGTTGAFGVGSNFGGFGASTTPATTTGTGLFGTNNNTTTTGFGTQTGSTTGGFGSATNTGGLFGAKPATGGLFGSTTTTPAQTGGGLFGNTTGGFGSTNTTGGFGSTASNTTGGGLFGNTATQNKPATGFGFGSTTTGTTGFGTGATTGGFGSAATGTTTTGGGLFGNTGATTGTTTTGGGLFGGAAQTGTTGTTTGFGSGTTTTGFGSQPQASGGLFGNKPAASGGLFGSTPATTTGTATTGGLFGGGGATNTSFGGGATQQSGGLFGAKPAAPATGGGLFGNAQPAAGTTTGGGLFGGLGQNQTTQPAQQSGGLFGGGGLGQNAQKPSLFGASAPATGGGLFGGQTATQPATGGGLFGQSTTAAQPQASGLGGSMFGNSQQQGNGLGASQTGLTTSINDTGAYGAPSLFQSLASQEVQNPGPLATPLSVSKNKTSRRSSILPLYKMNPGSASKFATPQKRGYGFSYSTFGTPSSAGSTSSTPGALSQSYMGGSIGRGGLSKSISSSNLRRSFNPEDSVLLPGAFSSNSGPRFYGNSGSSKKLVINRDMRSDLFSTPTKSSKTTSSLAGGNELLTDGTATGSRKLTKRVSFDTTIAQDTVPEQGPSDNGDGDMGYLRPPTRSNGGAAASNNGSSSNAAGSNNGNGNGSPTVILSPASPGQPEMEQVSSSVGKELAIVHEEDSPRCIPDNYRINSKELGEYYMIPSRAEIEKMNRVQRQQVANFTVGRVNVGQVRFRVPVDLTKIDLDAIFDGIVILTTRSATVYPDVNTKPPMGNGLNVPAEIMLLHTCPRSGPDAPPAKMKKHIHRLKNIPDTTFVSYDEKTAAWVFRVEHFTTYGLDDDDEDDETEAETTTMSAGVSRRDVALASIEQQQQQLLPRPKSARRKHVSVPGAFDDEMMEDDDGSNDEEEVDEDMTAQQSFLSSRSADNMSSQALVPIQSMDEDDSDAHMELGNGSGLYEREGGEAPYGLQVHPAAELNTHNNNNNSLDFSTFAPNLPSAVTETPAGIMRARLRAIKEVNTPAKLQVPDGDNWMEMLQKTVSPQKRDRAALKALGEHGAPDKAAPVSFSESVNFRSTFSNKNNNNKNNNNMAASVRGWNGQQNDNRGFATSIDLMNSLFEKAKAPASTVPATDTIAPAKGFVKWPYKRANQPADEDAAASDANNDKGFVPATEGAATDDDEPFLKRVRVFDGIGAVLKDDPLDNLSEHKEAVDIEVVDGVPAASTARIPVIKTFAAACEQGNQRRAADADEFAKELGAYEQSVWELASVLFDPIEGASPADKARQRRESLCKLWAQLVQEGEGRGEVLASTSTVEEKVLRQLAAHKVAEACRTLADGKNLKLATLVSLIGSSDAFKKDMGEQLDEWQESDVLAEFSVPVRSLYALLAGNVAVCEGKRGGGIENRMPTTVLSTYFGLDWKQAFGLRLWYGIGSGDGIESAVAKYVEDLEQGRVPAPAPWYMGSAAAAKFCKTRDSQPAQREDVLFGLLKVAAGLTRLEDVLAPENVQPSAVRFRFCWQLNQALSAAPLSTLAVKLPTAKADALTTSYAAEVISYQDDDANNNSSNSSSSSSQQPWVHAIWVLLHLSDRSARSRAIQDVLSRHAGALFADHGARAMALYDALVGALKIPAQWVWKAAARYWRNRQDPPQPLLEAECLLRAAAYADAHRIFVQELAPKAVVERSYGDIADMLAKLQPHRQQIKDWALGGEVYARFLDLLKFQGVGQGVGALNGSGNSAPRTRSRQQQQERDEADQASTQLVSTVEALVASLPAMYDNARSAQPTQVAAITEMADAVAKETMALANKGRMDLTKISRLPLTQDRRLRYSTDLAFAYYREVMSA